MISNKKAFPYENAFMIYSKTDTSYLLLLLLLQHHQFQ